MPYIVEVDQSIKIEQSGATVLALSNGITWAIVIPSHVKLAGQRIITNRGRSRLEASLLVFAACLYLLLEDYITDLTRVVIDVEYEGKDQIIKAALLRHIWARHPDFEAERLVFERVGKSSPADRKARLVRAGRDKAFRRITEDELKQTLGEK